MMKKTTKILLAISMAIFICDSAVSGGSFMRSTDSQIANLKSKLNKAYDTIALLNQSNSDVYSESQQKISILESNIDRLRRELDDRNQNSAQNIAVWEERVQNLTAQLNELSERILPYDCIKNIEAQQFDAAEKKLQVLRQNETIIADIIKRVYSGRMVNLPLLNNFGKSQRDIQMKLMVYKSLANALKDTDDGNVLDVVNLVNSVNGEIINQNNVPNDMKEQAIVVKNKLRDIIIKMAARILWRSMLDNTISSNSIVNDISNRTLYTVDNDLFFDVMTDVVNNMYGSLNTKRILANIENYIDLRCRMDGFTALFYRMKNENNIMYSEEMVDLVFHIHTVKRENNYDMVPLMIRNRFEMIKNELPQSLSALAFASSVCLKNRGFDEYLYADEDTKDRYRREVRTFVNVKQDSKAKWKIERHQDGDLSIKNVKYDEYLCYSTVYALYDLYDLSEKSLWRSFYSFTHIPKTNIPENRWRFISTSDGLKIMSMHDKELALLAIDSFHIFSKNPSNVYAGAKYLWGRMGPMEHTWPDQNYLWKVEECN